jgi:hypothetical protein
MKKELFSALLLIGLASTANANPFGNDVLVTGPAPFGVLTNATVDIPAPTGNAVMQLTQSSQYSQTFNVTVTGAPDGDVAVLYFVVDLMAVSFDGPPEEGFDDYSSFRIQFLFPAFPDTVGSVGLQTQPWLPQGSTSVYCRGYGSGGCDPELYFGTSEQMTFTANSFAFDEFGPYLNGEQMLFGNLGSSVTVEPIVYVRDLTTNTEIDNATVNFTPVDPTPDPGTAALVGMGFLLVSVARSRLGGLNLSKKVQTKSSTNCSPKKLANHD